MIGLQRGWEISMKMKSQLAREEKPNLIRENITISLMYVRTIQVNGQRN